MISRRRVLAALPGLLVGGALAQPAATSMVNVDRLLKGAQAAELPIEAPSKIELAVNLKAAAGLGLTLPPALLKQANRLIQ